MVVLIFILLSAHCDSFIETPRPTLFYDLYAGKIYMVYLVFANSTTELESKENTHTLYFRVIEFAKFVFVTSFCNDSINVGVESSQHHLEDLQICCTDEQL